jgi:hypothetical protein
MNFNGEFKDSSNNIFTGDINKLIPIKACNSLEELDEETAYAKKIILKRFGFDSNCGDSVSVIIYTNICETFNGASSQFPIDMIYEPNLPYPIKLLERPIVNRLFNKELIKQNHLRILKDTSFDTNNPKIQVVKDKSGREVYLDPYTGKIVVKYFTKFIIESNDNDYPYLPLYDNIIFNGKPTLIPSNKTVISELFDSGDIDGIAMTFNETYSDSVYKDCLTDFAEIFCPLTVENIADNYPEFIKEFNKKPDKLSVTKAYLRYIINLSNDADIINSIFLFDDIDKNKENILNLIREENLKIQKKINRLKGLIGPNGEIYKILKGSPYGNFAWNRRLGHLIIDEVEIKIGGQTIDKHYGIWLNVWYELVKKPGQVRGYDKMIGDIPELYTYNNKLKPKHKMYIPLYFWFCEDSGLYLPLVSLQYSEVTLNLKLRSFEELAYWEDDTEFITIVQDKKLSLGLNIEELLLNSFTNVVNNFIIIPQKPKINCQILAQYIYLDDKERKRFSKSRHEYLIHQLQYSNSIPVTKNILDSNIFFNSPCKEFIWTVQFDKFINGSLENGERQWYNYSISKYNYDSDKYNKKRKKIINQEKKQITVNDKVLYEYTEYFNNTTQYIKSPINSTSNGQIKIMGNPRIISRKENGLLDTNYLNYVQSYQHHSHTPLNGINLYSFALHPDDIQPSGAINMTKIDDSYLRVQINPNIKSDDITGDLDEKDWGKLYIYTRNYNVLRILSGMAGLAFSF